MFDDEVKEALKILQETGEERSSTKTLEALKAFEKTGALGLNVDAEEIINWAHVHRFMELSFPLNQKVSSVEFEEFTRILGGTNGHPEMLAGFLNVDQVMTLPEKYLKNIHLVIRLVMRDDIPYVKAEAIFNTLKVHFKSVEQKVINQHLLTHPQVPLEKILQYVNSDGILVPNFMQARIITIEEFKQLPLNKIKTIIETEEKTLPYPLDKTWAIIRTENLRTLKLMIENFKIGDGVHFWEAFKESNLSFKELQEMKEQLN